MKQVLRVDSKKLVRVPSSRTRNRLENAYIAVLHTMHTKNDDSASFFLFYLFFYINFRCVRLHKMNIKQNRTCQEAEQAQVNIDYPHTHGIHLCPFPIY